MYIPETLKKRLQEGTVIPFVGEGVSMAVMHRQTGKCLYPNWKELLEGVEKSLALAQAIWEIETRYPIITTNYDNVLHLSLR